MAIVKQPAKYAPQAQSGIVRSGGETLAHHVGEIIPIAFDQVDVTAGVANTTIKGRLYIPVAHRLRGIGLGCAGPVAVTGVSPTADVFRHLPVPGALVGALPSTPVAGNVDNGAHDYAVVFYDAAGNTTYGPAITVTVVDHTTNGKVQLSKIPIGPAGTTGRKIVRTKADVPGVYYVLTTIADNTTRTYLDNTADSGISVSAPTANTAGATVLDAAVSIDAADTPYFATPSDGTDPKPIEPCIYTLRTVTGASTGALTGLKVYLLVELLEGTPDE